MTLPTDDDELHWVLRNVVKLLDAHPEADATQLGVVAYAATPCGECRSFAADVLADRDAAPDWLREECRHDADEECRRAFEGA